MIQYIPRLCIGAVASTCTFIAITLCRRFLFHGAVVCNKTHRCVLPVCFIHMQQHSRYYFEHCRYVICVPLFISLPAYTAAFKAGEFDILIATDVAGRGLDIPDVAQVRACVRACVCTASIN